MNTSENETYTQALKTWMEVLPTEELPAIIDDIVSAYRQGHTNQEETEKNLHGYRFAILQWVKHNQTLEKVLQIPS